MRNNLKRILFFFLSASLITSFSVKYTMYHTMIDVRLTVHNFSWTFILPQKSQFYFRFDTDK